MSFRSDFFLFASTLALLSAPASASTPFMRVMGEIAFEKRHTIVPLTLCDEAADLCPRSEPYWAIVLQDDRGRRFEFHRIFSRGEDRMPESLALAVDRQEVTLRPGSHVTLEARVTRVSDDYHLLKEWRAFTFVMDSMTRGDLRQRVWFCSNPTTRIGPLEVEVHRAPRRALDALDLTVRVLHVDGPWEVARVRRPAVTVDGGRLVLDGRQKRTRIRLTLDPGASSDREVPGMLEISNERTEIMASLSCEREPAMGR